jgi:hypothetical protein
MGTAANFDLHRGSRLREFASLREPRFVLLLFAVLMGIQTLGFLAFGTERQGLAISESVLIVDNLLGLACIWVAFRRARGIAAVFWFLFAVILMVLLIPTAIQFHDTLFDPDILSASNWDLLYSLYGAPVVMMLFLPETHRRTRLDFGIFLDFTQVAIVVGLVYSTFFFLPAQRMLPADALLHDISITDAQSLLLLIAAFVRLQFARVSRARSLLMRLVIFLLVCAVVTFTGDWIGLRHYSTALAWFDLGWALPLLAAALLSSTWKPAPESQTTPEPENFIGFLGTNLVLVAMLSCVALLTDHWKEAHGETLTNVAIAASLIAFTLRLALTQFHQQQEIARRRAAQKQLTASHQKIGRLLDNAHRQTAEMTQISTFGSLLPACTSREESFASYPSACAVCFPEPPAASRCSTYPETESSRLRCGERVVWPTRAFHLTIAGPCAGDALTRIPEAAPICGVLTCSGKDLRSAFL